MPEHGLWVPAKPLAGLITSKYHCP
jgi:hypothetical protein